MLADEAVEAREAVAGVMLEGAALPARIVGQGNSAAPTPIRADQRAGRLGRHVVKASVPDDADETEHPPQYSTA